MPDVGDDELPNRQNPSPGVRINVGQSNIALLTVTTEKRVPWLADDTAHRLLHETWLEANAWLVGDYLLMPDHLHCFCAPHNLKFSIETWISYWKREFSLKVKRLAGTLAPPQTHLPVSGEAELSTSREGLNSVDRARPLTTHEDSNQIGGASVLASPFPKWKFQSRGWHHRLRDGESYSEKWLYVQENPVRKGLCQRIKVQQSGPIS